MQFCLFKSLALVLSGLALGVLVFVLLFTGTLTVVPASALGIAFFALVAALSGGGLLALAAAVLRANRSPALADAWYCCGRLAAIGAAATVLTALLTFLTASLEIGLYIGVSLIFFFLTLLLGGLLCFLQRYVTVCFSCSG